MILTHSKILQEIEKGTIKIEPFDLACLGTNSYDIHLGKYLSEINQTQKKYASNNNNRNYLFYNYHILLFFKY
jgi:deoxycytidine triphosphate deaminase